MSMEKYNKEQIRNRMLKYAAAFWGIKKAENFDPVVKLMLEALSNELYMLGKTLRPSRRGCWKKPPAF